MKGRSLLFLLPVGLCILPLVAFAQSAPISGRPGRGYFTHGKLRGVSHDAVMQGVAAAATIPMFDYSVTSTRDGNRYSGVMVGRSPFFHGARTTNIPAVIIPVKFTMSSGAVFDPTRPDAACAGGIPLTLVQNSPLLNPAMFVMPANDGVEVGIGQYIDEFQRANFWQNVSVTGDRFHTTLSPITTTPVQAVKVPAGQGKSHAAACGRLGAIDGQWWDSQVFGGRGHKAEALLTSLTSQGLIGPTTLPIFLFYNVVMDPSGDSACRSGCALGYHNAKGSPVQTYAVADYDTNGIADPEENTAVLSHEIGEWMDDPLGTNLTPAYGNVGQVTGCQNDLEVGDALTETEFPPVTLNGFDYTLQELAFFSWFYGPPSIAVDATFSDNGTFSIDAGPPCT